MHLSLCANAVSLTAGKVGANAEWLRRNGLTSSSDVAASITRYPTVLCFSIPDNLDHVLVYLRSELGLDSAVIKNVLINVPDLFGRSITTLRANVDAMRRAGMAQEDVTK